METIDRMKMIDKKIKKQCRLTHVLELIKESLYREWMINSPLNENQKLFTSPSELTKKRVFQKEVTQRLENYYINLQTQLT